LRYFSNKTLLGILILSALGCEKNKQSIYAGVAVVDITPPLELQPILGGYGDRMSKPACMLCLFFSHPSADRINIPSSVLLLKYRNSNYPIFQGIKLICFFPRSVKLSYMSRLLWLIL
jgi:hypothetical protein